jgi:hypothetical protein
MPRIAQSEPMRLDYAPSAGLFLRTVGAKAEHGHSGGQAYPGNDNWRFRFIPARRYEPLPY